MKDILMWLLRISYRKIKALRQVVLKNLLEALSVIYHCILFGCLLFTNDTKKVCSLPTIFSLSSERRQI